MKRSVILPLVFVIGILVFSSVASADLWEKIGLKRISGAPVAFNVGNPTELELSISKPKEDAEYEEGKDVWFVAKGKKSGGFPNTLRYNVYLDGEVVVNSQEFSAKGNSFVLTHRFPSENLKIGEHKLGIKVCGLYKGECVGEKSAEIYMDIKGKDKEKEDLKCPSFEKGVADGKYELNIGNSIMVGGARITITSVVDNKATLSVKRA